MTKIISLSDDAYGELKKLKRDLSFSKIILELARARRSGDISKYAGLLEADFADKMKDEIYKDRSRKSRRFS
jgi:predicted CopG family antitoxin